MVFVGRSELLTTIDRLTTFSAHGRGDPGPVLVVEGCGGSGRSALLEQVHASWHRRTPVASVRPDRIPGDEDRSIRPLLAAVMLGLSSGAPGYSPSFERVLLAYIAITAGIDDLDPAAATRELRRCTNEYRNRHLLEGLVRDLVNAVGAMAANIPAPGADGIAPAVANNIAEAVVARLRVSRWRSRLDWSKDALDWFGHQGQGLELDPEAVRVQLSVQARSADPAMRRDADDTLVAALLADLRHSVASTANRPANVLVLLDDGDLPSAISFTTALLRVREAVAHTPSAPDRALPDPLTVVTTSGGALTAHLARAFPVAEHANGSPPWRRVRLGDLQASEVNQLAKNHLWTDGLAASSVGRSVYRLTHGHPEATLFVLRQLRADQRLAGDVRALLSRDGPADGIPVDRHLLVPFVRGLTPDGHVDRTTLDALITLSAARNQLDAQRLTELLPPPIDIDSPVLTSHTLWSHADGPTHRLHRMVRYLGLRALAVRADGEPACWNAVFRRLLAGAAPDDVVSRLHYSRLLGEREAVSSALASLLTEISTREWLELFDQVVATPDPRERDIDTIRATGADGTAQGHTFRLLGVIPAIDEDPCTTSATVLQGLRAHARFSYRRLADHAQDPVPLLLRADAYA